jgi:hypothetical protein
VADDGLKAKGTTAMARVQVINQTTLNTTPEPADWTLWFQWCRYIYDNGGMEYGYRFIWKRPQDDGGSLQAARGQARIPSITMLERLVGQARASGWGDYDANDYSAPPVQKKIYVFYTAEQGSLLHFKALAEDGTFLAECDSASQDSAKGELTTPEKKETYKKHYPKYTLVWRGGPVDVAAAPPGGRVSTGSGDFVEVVLDHEFNQALAASRKSR